MANRLSAARDFSTGTVIDIGPEQLLRRPKTLRYERGGSVYAIDGLIGRLRHVVVDESIGEVVALAIQIEETSRVILLPIQAIDRTAGSAVYLTGSRQQFADWAARAPMYERKNASKANLKKLIREKDLLRDPRRAVLQAGRDFLETAAPPQSAPPTRPPLALIASNDRTRAEIEDSGEHRA